MSKPGVPNRVIQGEKVNPEQSLVRRDRVVAATPRAIAPAFPRRPVPAGDPASTSGARVAFSELDDDLQALIGGLPPVFGAPVQTVQNLRDVAPVDRQDKQMRLVEDAGAIYRFDTADTTSPDDGDLIIAPTDAGHPNGRWFKTLVTPEEFATHIADAAAHHARPVQATATALGIMELATQTEVDAGADAVRAVTPATLAARPVSYTQIPLEIRNQLVTGITKGGEITINGGDDTKFDVAAGQGLVVNNHGDPAVPTITLVTWTAFSLQTPTGLGSAALTTVGIDSVGAIVQQASDFTPSQLRDTIRIGFLFHPAAVILSSLSIPHVAFNHHLEFADFIEAFGPLNITGNNYSDGGANLNIDKTAGSSYRLGANYGIDKKTPSITASALDAAVSFFYTFRDGSGGFSYSAATALIDPTQYDDGTPPLGAVGATQWTIQRIFHFPGSDGTIIEYGEALFASLEDAEAAHKESVVVNPDLSKATFRTWLLVRGDATDLSDPAQAKFIQAGKFGLSDVQTGGGSGESNTVTNVGTAGVGIAKTKVGVDIPLKKLNAGSPKVTVTDDVGNDEVKIDVVDTANISIPEFTTQSGTYVVAPGGRFLFRGTTVLGTPTAINIIGGFVGTPGSGDYRVFDVSNSLVIAEVTGSVVLNPSIINLGALSNLPTGEAIWEVQLLRSAGTGVGNVPAISALQLQY